MQCERAGDQSLQPRACLAGKRLACSTGLLAQDRGLDLLERLTGIQLRRVFVNQAATVGFRCCRIGTAWLTASLAGLTAGTGSGGGSASS